MEKVCHESVSMESGLIFVDVFLMALDRSAGCNVYIYAANNPTQSVFGGLVLINAVTNNVFHSMKEILLIYNNTCTY